MATTKLKLGGTNAAGLPAKAVSQIVSYTTNGFSNDVNQVQFPLQLGVPIQNYYTFKVVPAYYSLNCIANVTSYPNVPEGAQSFTLPLNTTSQAAAGGNIPYTAQAITFNGLPGLLLDCERCLLITLGAESEQAFNVTVQGYDYRGVPLTIYQQIEIGETAFYLEQPISLVQSITFSASPIPDSSFTVQVGNGNSSGSQIGLPYYLPGVAFGSASFNWGASVYESLDYVARGNPWRLGALDPRTYYQLADPDSTSPARGYIATPTATDGATILVYSYYVYGADSEVNAELANLYASTLAYVGVQQNDFTVPQYVWPYITQYDLVGMQFNSNLQAGDNPAAIAYINALAATS